MKRKYVWLLFGVVASIYFYFCAYLFNNLTSDLLGKSGVEDIEQERDYLWEFVKPISECSCHEIGYEYLIPQAEQQRLKPIHQNGSNSCKFSPSSRDTDIEMSKVHDEMSMDYPAYVWTPSGWVQQMDTTYDENQWDTNPLQVHVVPFSHNDPGWLNTYESYYNSWTKSILDLIVEQLTVDPNLTFVWSEVLFLQRWYTEANAKEKEAFKRLLESKRFEIVTGGWVMTDEAITHYGAIIDQLMEGHLWLRNELGYQVNVSWSIDSFGYSSTVSHLLHLSGIKAMYIHRAHYAVKKHLAFKKQLEFNWQQDWDQKMDSSIFCHLSPYLFYGVQYSCGPDINVCCQFDFTHKKCWKWGDYQPAQPVTSENVKTKAYELLDQLRKKAQFFQHEHVIFPFGDDFRFTSFSEWELQFKNLTKIFSYMNSHPEMKVQVQFSTLGKYLEAARSKPNVQYPTLKGDFFPYSDRSDQYWSGYFSSRPVVKSLARTLQSRLRSVELLFSYAAGFDQKLNKDKSQKMFLESIYNEVQFLRRELGLLQHHDSITGTSRISVVSDTLDTIKTSLEKSRTVISRLLSMLPQFRNERVELTVLEEQLSSNSMPKAKLIEFDSKGESIVILFNPLAKELKQIVRLSVPSSDIKVFDMNKNSVQCQVTPVLDQKTVFQEGQFEVYFEVTIGGLGVVSYRVKRLSADDRSGCHRSKLKLINIHIDHQLSSSFNISWHETPHLSISNHHLVVTFCKCTYLMQSIITKRDMIPYKAEMKFGFYRTGHWINPFADKSGAYIFLPDGPAKDMGCRKCKAALIEGPLVSSVTTWMNITSQTITLFNTDATQGFGVHVTNFVDLQNHDNVEVLLKLKTSVVNSNYFYTDLNGFQMHRRQTLNRFPIQGNFYPMTSSVFIQDERIRFSVLSAESHGVASLTSGTLEMILDRRLAQDDWRGLKEGVQDNIPASSRFILVVEEWKRIFKSPKVPPLTTYPSRLVHQLGISLENPPILLSSSVPQPPFSLLNHATLPCDSHLVNMRSFPVERNNSKGHSLLVVMHRVGVACDIEDLVVSDCTDSDKIVFSSVFQNLTITSVDEMTLTGTSVLRHVLPDAPTVLGNMAIKTWKLHLK